jgi:hypothetical protein
VKEEAKLHLVEALMQKSGKHHEMVVMHPDIIIIWADHLHDFLGEYLVYRDIGLSVQAVEVSAMDRVERDQVVEEGPQHLLAKAMIEPSPQVLGEEGRYTIEIL